MKATSVQMTLCRSDPRIIRSAADIRAGVRHLRRACPTMRSIHERTGDPPLRRYSAGFEGLARIVTGQQLSIASAAAIWGRLSAAFEPFHAGPSGTLDRRGTRRARPLARKNPHLARALGGGRGWSPRARRSGHGQRRGHQIGTDRRARHRPVDRRHLHPVLSRPCRRMGFGRSSAAGRRGPRTRRRRAAEHRRSRNPRRALAPVARSGRAPHLGGLRQPATRTDADDQNRSAAPSTTEQDQRKALKTRRFASSTGWLHRVDMRS